MVLTNSIAYGTRRFNAAFTWAELTQFFVWRPISLRSYLILSSHLRLGLPKGLFPVGLTDKILKTLLHAICPAHLNLPALITLTILGERYKL